MYDSTPPAPGGHRSGAPTDRVRVRRKPQRGRYDRETIESILDEGLIAHVGYVVDGQPYVIHDTNGGSYLGADGQMHSMHLNGVSLTPLLPLSFGKDHDYVDRITNIVKVTRLQ